MQFALLSLQLFVMFMMNLGFKFKYTKLVLPTTCAKVIGFVWNTVDQYVELPADKQARALNLVQSVLAQGRLKMGILRRLGGLLVQAPWFVLPICACCPTRPKIAPIAGQ